MSANTASQKNTALYIKWAICIAVPVIIMLLPTNELFTSTIRLYAAVTMFGISMFLFELMIAPLIAFSIPAGYALLGVCDINTAISSWGHNIVWQSMGVLLILEAVNATPLLKRLAYNIILKVGGSYLGILFGMALIGIVVAFLIPSATSAILVIGIGYGLCCALKFKPGDKAAVGIMFMSIYGVTEAQNFVYNPQGQGTAIAFISTAIPGFEVGYTEIIIDNLVFIPMVFIMAFMFSKLFKAEKITGLEEYRAELDALGKLQKSERNALIILLVMVIFLVTSKWHGYNMAFAYILAGILLYFPGLHIATMQDFKRVDMAMPMLIASCMAIGTVGTAVGAGNAISQVILPILSDVDSAYVFTVGTFLAGFVANMLMTPLALMSLLSPVMGPIADALGYSPKVVAYVLYQAGNSLLFPYENNTILIMYGFGMMSMGQFIKGSACKALLNLVWICALGIPYWMFLGYL